jgi:DNA-binding SARP family transcriptional activator
MRKPETLRVRCLGTFAYRGDGVWENGPTFKRGRELLQYLATYARAAASSETLVDAFWPDADNDAVRHRLHLAVAGARAALRQIFPTIEAIRCVGGSYGWNPALEIVSDVDQLFAYARAGTTDAMKRGVALYGGEYCSGENAEWMFALRVRAQSAYVTMLERLAEDAVERLDHATALEYALQLAEADRGHEGAARLVMRAFAAVGRRSAALAQYDALRRWLARHLNVEPSRATVALREEIAAGG